MRQSSKRLISLIIAIVFIFAAFYVYFNYIESAYALITKTRAEIYGQQDLLDTQKRVVEKVTQALKGYDEKETQVKAAVASAIPPGEDAADVAAQISGLAAQSQMAVQSITATTPTVDSAKSVNPNPASEGQFRVRPVGILSFQVKVAGTYANFKSFLSKLESNIRIMDVKSLTVEELGKPNQDFYLYTLNVVTYYQTQ